MRSNDVPLDDTTIEQYYEEAVGKTDFVAATGWMDQLVRRTPHDLRRRQRLAHLLILSGDIRRARTESELILVMEPDNPEILQYLAHIEKCEQERAEWERVHYAQVGAILLQRPSILFLGDSLTAGWQHGGRRSWDKHFAAIDAGIMAIAGDTTEKLTWRLKHSALEWLSVRLVVTLIGTNDLERWPPPLISQQIAILLDNVKRKLPGARILLLGVLPRGAEPGSIVRIQIRELNDLLKVFHDDFRTFFLDLGCKILAETGHFSTDIAPDGLHLSDLGYGRLAPILQSAILELSADPV